MARITIARQCALIAAHNTRNNTISTTSRIALAINPPIIIEKETVNNPISLKDLNHQRLQDQID
jgi:hypothetical protein